LPKTDSTTNKAELRFSREVVVNSKPILPPTKLSYGSQARWLAYAKPTLPPTKLSYGSQARW